MLILSSIVFMILILVLLGEQSELFSWWGLLCIYVHAWREATIVPIPKLKSPMRDPNNPLEYRGISLL